MPDESEAPSSAPLSASPPVAVGAARSTSAASTDATASTDAEVAAVSMAATVAAEHSRGLGIAFALASAAGFSTLGLFAKLIYSEGFSVAQALAWRFTAAAALLWIVVFATRRRLPKPLLPVLLLGLFGFAPQAGLYFLTVSILDPGIASLLLYLYPSFVVLFGFLVFKKKPSRVQLFALGLALAGSVVTFWKRGEYPIVGIALGALVGVAYGAYLVAGERVLAKVDSISATAVIMLVAAAVYWTFAMAGAPFKAPSSIPAILGVLGVSVLATVLPITTLFASMRRIGAADASLVSTLEPVLTVALSAIVIGEKLGPARVAGGLLILSAVLVLDLAPRISRFGKPR